VVNKDWIVYIDEFDKVKAWEVTGMTPDKYFEVKDTIQEVGFKIVGICAFAKEHSAIDYGKFLASRSPVCRLKSGNQHLRR
jgi:hypothetical protein